MISSKNKTVLEAFRTSFSRIDQTLQSRDVKISRLAELATITVMLNAFAKRYEKVLDNTEKEILRTRIDAGIDKLVKIKEKDMWALWYFGRDFRKNPYMAEFRVRCLMISVRGLFELASVSRIPLDSTLWNYFIDQVSKFVYQLTNVLNGVTNNEMRGRLSFLLIIVIHSLSSILEGLKDANENSKITELRQNCEYSIRKATKSLWNLHESSKLEHILSKSPGLAIYLKRVLKEDLSGFEESMVSELMTSAVNRVKMLDFEMISDKHKNFHILNAMELGQESPEGILPSGNDAPAFLAKAFIRFESGEEFLGVLPIQDDLRTLLRKLVDNVATKTDIDKIERFLVSQQEEIQEKLRRNMKEIKEKLQLETKIEKEKTGRLWKMLDKIATVSDVIDFTCHVKEFFAFLNENKEFISIILPLILKLITG